MSININSESWCKKAYLNYERYGNSMNLTTQEYYEIRQVWSHKLASWDAAVASDENEYEIKDDDYANYKKEGAEEAEKDTGYDGDDQSVTGGIFKSLFSGAGLLMGSGLITPINQIYQFTGTGKVTKNGGSWSIAAPLSLTIALLYYALRPNKKEKEACDKLQQSMSGSQEELATEQTHMEEAAENTCALSDEANDRNEEGNDEIAKKKAEYDLFMAQYLAIEGKIDSKEELTGSEKQLYKDLGGILSEIGVEIDELSETTGDEVEDLYDEIGEWQETYDVAAETIGEIEGLTDFSAGFDENTRTMCIIEAVTQGINAVTGFLAGTMASISAVASLGFNAWAWACAAMGFTASGLSTDHAVEQGKMAKQVGVEIDMRKATQELNTETMGIYEEELDGFDGILQGVEDLELDIPEDVSAPEETTIPANTNNNNETDGQKATRPNGFLFSAPPNKQKPLEKE